MEAHGSDGNIAANDTHVTISWKTLRGRLSSVHGASLEVIPIARIFETIVIPATAKKKGCIQFHIIGNPNDDISELNWMSSLHKGRLNQTVMFTEPMQFEFQAMASHIQARITALRNMPQLHDGDSQVANGA